MKTHKEEKRQRLSNFTDTEIRTIIVMYAENAQLLSCNKHTSYLINEKKRAVWQEITDAVNTHTSVKRTRKSVKKKWMELKRQTIILSSQRKKSRAEGDVLPAEPWYVNYILDIVGDKNPVLEGVDGGCDSGKKGLFGIGDDSDPDDNEIDSSDIEDQQLLLKLKEEAGEVLQSASTSDAELLEKKTELDDGQDLPHSEQEQQAEQFGVTKKGDELCGLSSEVIGTCLSAALKDHEAAWATAAEAPEVSSAPLSNRAASAPESHSGIRTITPLNNLNISAVEGSVNTSALQNNLDAFTSQNSLSTSVSQNSHPVLHSVATTLVPSKAATSASAQKEASTGAVRKAPAASTSAAQTGQKLDASAEGFRKSHSKTKTKAGKRGVTPDSYDVLVDVEIKKTKLQIAALKQKRKAMTEKRDLECQILKLQLQREERAAYKQNLEIRLLEKQLNIQPVASLTPPNSSEFCNC